MRKDGVQSLGSLLSRYRTLTPPQGIVVDVFIEVVSSVCVVSLKKTQISYKPTTKTIGLLFAGPRKNEILLNKNEILRECAKRLGQAQTPRLII